MSKYYFQPEISQNFMSNLLKRGRKKHSYVDIDIILNQQHNSKEIMKFVMKKLNNYHIKPS